MFVNAVITVFPDNCLWQNSYVALVFPASKYPHFGFVPSFFFLLYGNIVCVFDGC